MIHLFLPLAQKTRQQALFNVINIRRTLTNVRIIDAGKMRGDFTENGRNSVLGGNQLFRNKIFNALLKTAITQKTHMNSKDVLNLALFNFLG